MTAPSPFHEGEQQVQARLGVRERVEPWARQAIRPFMTDQHRRFHESLPFLVAAARDAKGRPWATVLAGSPGFVRAPAPERLTVDARPVRGDALEGALVAGAELGLLGIALETRRRNRVNGRIVAHGEEGLAVAVEQAFGNCPQYIRERAWRRVRTPSERPPARRAGRLTAAMRERIRRADTFFIASGYSRRGGRGGDAARGMDASHRGGDPGFVEVQSDTRLVFPDYAGNDYYNTIGNLVMDPRAGLLFVDFERGGLLQLTGRARIDWDSAALARFPGARRLVAFDLDEAVALEEALPLRWSMAGESVRTLRLVEKTRESADVASFVFEARDGGQLPGFEAGQHLPILLRVPGRRAPVRRTYSLSSAPGRQRYRISVKRERLGAASRHLHDALDIGALVDAHPPAGEFVLSAEARPAVLAGAGIGVTPLVSMLHALADEPAPRRVAFVHAARDGAHHPLAEEVRELVARRDDAALHVAYSRPRPHDVPGVDYHSAGRVDAGLIARVAGSLDAEFYLCGPVGFMAVLAAGLTARGVPPSRIHTESFGPAG